MSGNDTGRADQITLPSIRLLLNKLEGSENGLENGLERRAASAGSLGPVYTHALIPVSYTHLDVYKRQALRWKNTVG